MGASTIADLRHILSRATPIEREAQTPVRLWVIVLAVLCAAQLIVIVILTESMYLDETGPMIPVATEALDIMVRDLAETRHTTPAAVWQELGQKYRFDNPMALSRRDGRRVLEGVTAALMRERSTPTVNDEP